MHCSQNCQNQSMPSGVAVHGMKTGIGELA
jgi:hypothetical protein